MAYQESGNKVGPGFAPPSGTWRSEDINSQESYGWEPIGRADPVQCALGCTASKEIGLFSWKLT